MKEVNDLEDNQHNDSKKEKQKNKHIKMKKFTFVMLIFLLVFSTAGITTFVLSFGEEKVADVGATSSHRQEFAKLFDAYDELHKEYYKSLDDEKLISGAINGMVDALDDPYSDYLTVEEAEKFHESISSSFEGIGAEIQEQGGYVVVVSPIKGSPAEKAGLKPNDKILEVDEKSIRGMSASEAVLLIRGKKGTKVKLKIQRGENEKPSEVTITRDEIPVETVYTEKLKDDIWKVQITSFSENTYDDLLVALEKAEKKGMKGLILDLRQNPGGLLDQAINISNLFIPEGKLLFQTEMKDGSIEKFKADNGEKIDIPLAIIIDDGSASASEILAAAVKESADVPLIGNRSFGKGTVQTAKDFSDGSNLKYTSAKWLTPKGNWIHEKGIKPDHKVNLPKYASLPFINPDNKLKESSLSDEVKVAKQMLKALGYKPGKIDGYYSEETVKAVKAFQKDEKLKVDGILHGDTTMKLMNKLRDKIEKNDTQVKKAVEVLKEETKQ